MTQLRSLRSINQADGLGSAQGSRDPVLDTNLSILGGRCLRSRSAELSLQDLDETLDVRHLDTPREPTGVRPAISG